MSREYQGEVVSGFRQTSPCSGIIMLHVIEECIERKSPLGARDVGIFLKSNALSRQRNGCRTREFQ